MKRRSVVIVGALAVACAPSGGDGPAYEPCSAATVDERCNTVDADYAGSYPAVDAIIDTFMTNNAVSGCGLGLTYGDDIVYLSGYGFADVEGNDEVPYRLDTMQPVASITKTITALALFRMLSTGRLPPGTSLDTPIEDLLPSTPELIGSRTLRELLNHSAGLPGNTPYEAGFGDDSWLADTYPANAHPGMHPRILWWGHKDNTNDQVGIVAPGTGSYANTNFRVLASIVDFYSVNDEWPCGDGIGLGSPTEWSEQGSAGYYCGGYEKYTRGLLASPSVPSSLRMSTMCLEALWRYPTLPTLARSFQYVAGPNPKAPNDPTVAASYVQQPLQTAPWVRNGSSGWMMTVGDLARMLLAIDQLSAVDPAGFASMIAPANSVAGDLGVTYGLGTWPVSQSLASTGQLESGFEHGGDVVNYSSFYRMVQPASGPSIGVALLCNASSGSVANREALMRTLINQVDQDFTLGAMSPVLPTSVGACSGEASETSALLSDWGDEIHTRWVGYVGRADGDARLAEQLVRRDLMAAPGGRQVLADYDAGNIESAAAGLARIFARGY